MSQNAIELHGLRKTYAATKKTEAKTALSGIDLDIQEGQSLACWAQTALAKPH